MKGIPVHITSCGRVFEESVDPKTTNAIALTHSELKELMREAENRGFEAAREQQMYNANRDCKNSIENPSYNFRMALENKYPDFETYYKQRGEG